MHNQSNPCHWKLPRNQSRGEQNYWVLFQEGRPEFQLHPELMVGIAGAIAVVVGTVTVTTIEVICVKWMGVI